MTTTLPAPLALLCILLVVSCGTARAQSPLLERLNEGARVQLWADSSRMVGEAVGTRNSTDLLRFTTHDDDARVDIPLSALRRLDVSYGRARAKGAALGALAGTIGGGALAAFSLRHEDGLASFAGTLAGMVVGAPLGAVGGYLAAPERWHRVLTAPSADRGGARVVLREGAKVRLTTSQKTVKRTVQRFSGDTAWVSDAGQIRPYALRSLTRLEVRGEPNRRAGMIRGAAVLGGIAVVFGGIDTAGGNSTGGEYVSAIVGNSIIGAVIGYFIAPRGWQSLPIAR